MYQHWFFKKSPIEKVGYWKIIPSCLESVCVWSWEGGVAVRRSLRHGLWENLKWKEWFMVQTRQGVVITCVKLAFVSIIWCGSGPREVRWDSRTVWRSVEERPLIFPEALLSHRQNGAVHQCLPPVGNWHPVSPGSFGKPCGSTSIHSQWGMRTLKYLLTNFCHS